MKNYYDILQISPNADEEVINAATKALVRKHHPDRGGKTEKAALFHEAKDILANKENRKKFDKKLRDFKQGKKRIGNYAIIDKMAEGGFGAVYKAKHVDLDEYAVIKHNLNISAEDTDLFIKEAKAIWDLRHHAIPAMRDFVKLEDGSCALIMSYIEGPTLFEVIKGFRKSGKEMDAENVAWIIERILDALRYIHFHGVVHGDIKPANIIVQPKKHTCYLVDFGLASIRPDRKSFAKGYTPVFAPPEVIKAAKNKEQGAPLLPESDLYSLGLVACYAFGGNPAKRHLPRSVPKPIADFLTDLLIYDINNRPHWDEVDLVHKFREARIKAFGRAHTNYKELIVPE